MWTVHRLAFSGRLKMSCSGFVYDAGGGIWKWNILNHTVGKTAKCNKCDLTSIRANKNAINATLHVLIQVIWVNIWNHTVEKSQINATNVTLPLFGQTIWGDISKHTVEKSEILRNMLTPCSFRSEVKVNFHRAGIWTTNPQTTGPPTYPKYHQTESKVQHCIRSLAHRTDDS